MQFYPFDTLHIKPNRVVVWLLIDSIPQGCRIESKVGDAHKNYPAFKAASVLRSTDCLGGEICWEAPFMAAPPEILNMVSALKAPTSSPVCEGCGANGCPTLATWSLCAACRE